MYGIAWKGVVLLKIVKRRYQPGDEVNINKLYRLITNIDRTVEKHRWEWVDTWKGQGSMWLAFDDERTEGDRLIMQFSLIPTPFSFWGRPYLAGKTENCMCHPDYRGKGQYFQHEKESFEEARQEYDLFFTTAGDVSKGTVGAIRRKLGYVAFDAWTQYVFCLNKKYVARLSYARLEERKKIPVFMVKFLAAAIAYVFAAYFKLFTPAPPAAADIRIFCKHDAPMEEIERFWNRIKDAYPITVDRTRDYLAWRINRNPYYDYHYLLYYRENHLAGYAIFFVNVQNSCVITDILAENRDTAVFDAMIANLIRHAREIGADAVSCGALTGNTVLKDVFARNRFIDLHVFRKMLARKKNLNAFHVYLSPKLASLKGSLDPRNWYMTDLVKEGRLRTSAP